MPSSLTWLDHDTAARERSLRILALFREKESRDEMGIGGIRDAIADRLFPGTSTIQTRLRYMLLVPWIYRRLEDRHFPPNEFAARARRDELALVQPLLDAREKGVYGAVAKGELKRLPSSVYWAGLQTWGIRRFPSSQQEYHSQIGQLYARRDTTSPAGDERRDAEDSQADRASLSWHPKLPPAPPEFPDQIDLRLTAEEANFLVDCVAQHTGDSLLRWLVLNAANSNAEEPWLHPRYAEFPGPMKQLLTHARMFTDLIEAATRLYNLSLAELDNRPETISLHRRALEDWARTADLNALNSWSLDGFWSATLGYGHTITKQTQRFVEALRERVRVTAGAIADDAPSRELIQHRERGLKGPRSRFTNRGALTQWSGHAGIGRLVYRWPTVKTFLSDFASAPSAS